MKFKKLYSSQIKNSVTQKLISSSLAIGLMLNSVSISFAGILSDDGRYETFEGNSITIDNILEEDKVDIEIEGNSFVNVFDYSKLEKLSDIPNSHGFSIKDREITRDYTSIQGIEPVTYLKTTEEVIKKGETYTFVIDITNNTLDKAIEFYPYLWRYAESFKGTKYLHPNYIGKSIISFKAIIDSPVYLLYAHNYPDYTGSVSITNIMLLKGDYYDEFANNPSSIPEYFEGIKSVGEDNSAIEIKSSNSITSLSSYIYGKGLVSGEERLWDAPNRRNVLDYTNVNPNTSYTVIHENVPVLNFYDSQKRYLGYINTPRTFVTPKDCYYIRASLDVAYGEFIDIVESSKILKMNNQTIIMIQPLRKVSDGVKDRIIKRNGQWIIERNLAQYTITGNENWLNDSTTENNLYNTYRMMLHFPTLKSGRANIISDKFSFKTDYTVTKDSSEGIFGSFNGSTLYIDISKEKIDNISGSNINEKFKTWLSQNPVTIVYELLDVYTEPINADLSFDLYEDTTYISNSSTIPANMKVTVDRAINKAVEAIELAKTNPTISNISEARYWTNLLKESIEKDELQSEINSITNIEDLQLEKKTVTANVDMYIKSENALSLSLSSNSITFKDFNGTEDLELNGVIEMTVDSSLPYEINAYLEEEIQNADKTAIMDKQILNLKESSTSDYKEFTDVKTKLTLISNSDAGNNKIHNFDFKLNGGIAHKADVYKTTIKFEAVQK